MSDVLAIGGYGAVGTPLTSSLARRFPGRVIPAGRDPDRARRLARTLGSDRAARVDVTDLPGFERVLDEHRPAVVVLCVEPPDAGIARACLARGVHLVDVGASHHLLAQVEALAGVAVAAGATAALSVGVAPGLTNLLALRAHEAVGGAERVDLTVMIGGGERHGADGVRWVVEQLARPAAPDGPPAGPRAAYLPGHGTRTARPFPFSDQHTLRRTLGVPEVTTRLCLDSAALTTFLFGLRRAVRRPALRRLVTASLTRVHIGGDAFAVRADAVNGRRHAAFALTGHGQSRATALVAAHVTAALLEGTAPPGVHHIERLPGMADLPESLAPYGITFWPPDTLAARAEQK
ncbi:hypothetical protein Sru01_43710 [Sphaerisporangium rufum]|uniref:Saccharopine dehydrogenase NADP binding domain-containing protein n=1 Tax=Sphaerisporangium rufum TaxID=1381558 RepID=A0A919R478_9ACTN|nr:saccharopine dehydrogenase NADP-binding domain-containing protein [Sphaerisporangium rufum]GII79389.1 hypothetical protein Sru01_43710 [Sphaerisporangium rufum]